MKNLNKIFLFVLLSFFTLTNYTIAAEKDCSGYRTFSHKWNMCKLGQLPELVPGSEAEAKADTESTSENTTGKKLFSLPKLKMPEMPEMPKTLVDVFKKKN